MKGQSCVERGHQGGAALATGAQNNHVCVENSMRQNCPVCFEYLFDSVRPTAVLSCGHTIHSDCLKEMEHNRQVARLVSHGSWRSVHQR